MKEKKKDEKERIAQFNLEMEDHESVEIRQAKLKDFQDTIKQECWYVNTSFRSVSSPTSHSISQGPPCNLCDEYAALFISAQAKRLVQRVCVIGDRITKP